MAFDKLVVLCPLEKISVEPASFLDVEQGGTLPCAEDAVEDLVVGLAAIEAAWSEAEFGRMKVLLPKVADLGARTGLPDVAHVAQMAEGLLDGFDDIAFAAVIARLIRVGETSLAAMLEISYRQN